MSDDTKSPKDRLVYGAKLAEQAERFDDMKEKMKARSEMPEKLSTEERNLLSVAYKNIIGARRSAWRVISSIESKDTSVDYKKEVSAEYKTKIENELDQTSDEVIGIIDKCLDKEDLADEEKVFYNKMKGDYYRYKAEYKTGDVKSVVGEQAREAYEKSLEEAETSLKSTHPIRLGLALNFSVFYYEILQQPDKACEMAKKAFDNAIQELDSLEEDCYKDSTLIMQLLRDNLTLWTSDTNQDDDNKGDGQDDDN